MTAVNPLGPWMQKGAFGISIKSDHPNYKEIIEYIISNQIARKVVLFLNSPKSPYIALTKYGAEFQATNNLKEFIEKTAECSIALTAAGGSSHIASAAGLKVVVISGIKNQAFWRPYGKKAHVS